MSFSTRRGRPAKPKIVHDCGTPELQAKKALGLTQESIDLCLERNLITRDQHWAGLHLRWLYTVRYGAPTISSHWWRLSGESHTPRHEHTQWRAEKEAEYNEARSLLMAHKYYEPTMQIAVYNDMPAFLNPTLLQRALANESLMHRIESEQRQFSAGLKLLATLWHTQQSTHKSDC